MGSYQKKIITVDQHLGIALAGLAPDARVLSNFLREQAMSQKMVYNRPLSVEKASNLLADKAQKNTQSYGGRPYGVGLLVAGYDETGAHLFEFQPSGSVLEYVGTAIGARSQAGRTYLERNFESYTSATKEELIVHGLNALRDTLAQDKELNSKNTSIAVVGKDTDFTLYDDDDVQPWLDRLDSTSNARTSGGGNDDNDDDDNNNADGADKESKDEEIKDAPSTAADDEANEDRMETD